MKKSVALLVIGLGILLSSVAFIQPAKSPAPDLPKGIPDSVWTIIEKCCLGCHSTNGNGFAKAKINFEKWDTYTPEKQTYKAKDICEIIRKGKMPPAGFVSKNPECALKKSDIDLICSWGDLINR